METINQIIDYIKHNKKNTAIIILSLIIFLTSCFFIYKINEKPKIKIVEKKIIKKIKIKEEKKLIVDIKGEVKNPGVYEVKKNTRINDVIKLAGGLTYKANTKYINLSKKVKDEMVIFIYSYWEINSFKEQEKIKEELPTIEDKNLITSNKIVDETSTDVVNSKININSATLEQLMTLTGIGESKAKSIIEYREKNKFKTIDDLKEVSGIGDSIFDKIKENITV